MQKYGGQGQVVSKKFGLRKAYYAVPKPGVKQDQKPTITFSKQEMSDLHQNGKIEKGNVVYKYTEE